MENKINIAELLKNCPTGMELDCTLYENVVFDYIDSSPESVYPIRCLTKILGGYNTLAFTHNGCNNGHPNAKCVIFPKGKTTWEGFHRPFKDGDIVVDDIFPFIYKNCDKTEMVKSYCGIDTKGNFWKESNRWTTLDKITFATEEEKEILFKAIKDNGYKWNDKTKTLEKLIEPIFKVGNKIKYKNDERIVTITGIKNNYYFIQYFNTNKNDYQTAKISIEDQDKYELVPDKFDITTLKPFEKVLVRDFDNEAWNINFFSRLSDTKYFKCLDLSYIQCIPYEGNEHLHGTTDACNDYFKIWEE